MSKVLILSLLVIASALFTPQAGHAAASVGKVAFVSGQSWLMKEGKREFISEGQQMYPSDVVITGTRGRVKLVMNDGSKVYIGARSKISLEKYAMDGGNLLTASFDMFWGKARFFVNKLVANKSSFQVRTSTAVLGVRGTEFLVIVPPTVQMLRGDFDRVAHASLPALPTRMVLVHGVVEVGTEQGFSQQVTAGQTTDVDVLGQGTVRETQESDLDSDQSDSLAPPESTEQTSEEPTASGNTAAPEKEGEDTQDETTDDQEAGTTDDSSADGSATDGSTTDSSAAGVTATEAPAVEEPVVVEEVIQPVVEPTVVQDVPTTVNTTITNAIQSLGTTTDVNIQPSFVVP